MKTCGLPVATAMAVILAAAPVVRAAEDPLGAAKTLYLAAAYEDALAALTNLPPGVDADQADKFRALCLLALNRTDDAQQTLERLAARRPTLRLDAGESPKLVTMFRDARARVLPAAIRSLYAGAKGRFEQGDLKTAAAQFRDVIVAMSDGDLASDSSLSDIKLLAEGFVKLADQQLAATERPALAAPPTEAAATATPAPAVAAKSAPSGASPPPPARDAANRPPDSPPAPPLAVDQRIYSSADGEVVPPVAIDQAIPQWVPPVGNYRYQEYAGVLDIVVDEAGTVVSASMSQRLNVVYDQLLLRAAKRWRYRPAQRGGLPVKYHKQFNIVLRPSPSGAEPVPSSQPRIPEVR